MSDVTSTLLKPPNYPAPFALMTNQGAFIAVEQVSTGGLASGDNTVDLPADIVQLPIAILVALHPDDVVVIVKSFSLSSGVYKVVLNAAAAASSGVTLLLLVPASGPMTV